MRLSAGRGSTDAPREWRLVATARTRGPTRLSEVEVDAPPDPELAVLLELAARHVPEREDGRAPVLWLSGGEPTLRADLPDLIHELVAAGRTVGLCTDGLALSSEPALRALVDAGLSRLRVTLHSARSDAHDWLVGRPGAARAAAVAIRRAKALGVSVEIAATVTRPTMPHLGELCEAAAGLGVRTVHLRRLVGRGQAAADIVALSARLSLLPAYLEKAVLSAAAKGVTVALQGFPECTTGRARDARVPPDRVRWLAPEGDAWQGVLSALVEPPTEAGCPSCPGPPRCAGAPSDYVARFGGRELEALGSGASVPPPEVIRFRFGAPSRVACPVCGDGGVFTQPEPTRTARLRLVWARELGAAKLRVASAGSLAHPQAAELLREAALLFDVVEIAGEASALSEWSDADLYRLKGIARLDVALYGPDAARHDDHVGRPGAFEAALAGGARFAELTGAKVGAFAVLHDATLVADFARAWAQGRLPGSPVFRLSAKGGALGELAHVALALGDGACRRALLGLLPPCLAPGEPREPPSPELGAPFESSLAPGAPPSGSDCRGIFEPCVCTVAPSSPCPGLAFGWLPPEVNR